MVSRKDVFGSSGPFYLTTVNWNNPHHQRSVAASLVQGTYVLERDRQKERQGPRARAHPWWEFFQFDQIEKLIDDDDSSIFGAIYEFKPPGSVIDPSALNAPKYVIAFRGTLLRRRSMLRDIELDLRVLINRLEKTSRSRIATEAVIKLVSDVGNHENIWLAGHSLGSSLAMLAGKRMAREEGIHLKAFLFNPPFLSTPIDRMITNERFNERIRVVRSFLLAGVAAVVKGHQNKSNDYFDKLCSWVPNIFVNSADIISSEYIGHFRHRNRMEGMGAETIERIATMNSFADLFSNDPERESEPLHLLPSAILTENLSFSDSERPHGIEQLWNWSAHGIHQWWKESLNLQSSNHHFQAN